LSNAIREREFIGISTEFNIVAEEFSEFHARWSTMTEPNTVWQNAKARQLPANPNHSRHPIFDLVPIQMAADTNVMK
jgi:hypothetical protein